jgi:protein disulfide-isomerase
MKRSLVFGHIQKAALLAFLTLGALVIWAQAQEQKEKETSPKEATEPATEVSWLTDFAKAKETAEKEKKPILMNFSGSDWCGWCIRLDKEVFSQEAFKKYAKENLVLFVADFPRQIEQAEELKKRNGELAEEYGVQGFPTVIVAAANGDAKARTGYRAGGAESYVDHLKRIIKDTMSQEE